MPKVLITEKFISTGLICPENKRRIEFCCTHLPGHYIEVRSTSQGQGTHYLRYKDATGKTCHQKIGRTCDLTLKQAREEAKRLRAEIQLGANPRAEARAKKDVMTWKVFMDTIYIPHVKAHLRSWKNLVSLNEKYLEPAIGNLALDRISLQTAQKLHRDMIEVHELSPASADHLAKLLRQAMNYAVRVDLLTSSQISKIRLFNVDNRQENLMTDTELQRLMAVLNINRSKTACSVIKLLIFTGARVSEALHARWVDIDHANRTWKILAINNKSRRSRSVPLSDAALEVINALPTKGKSEFLFTNTRTGERLTTVSRAWAKLKLEAQLPSNVRLYDATRHQFASMAVNSGRTLFEVQKILGHSDSKVTERYAKLSTTTLQDAANSVGKYMEKALDKTGEQ